MKNLNVTHYRNGDIIPEVTDPKEWAELKTGAWCYYNNDPANGEKYGKLYNWYAVNDPRGLAPEGCHIPTIEEMMRKKWKNDLPGGYCSYFDGTFNLIGNYGYWWSSTEYDTYGACYRFLSVSFGNVFRSGSYKRNGFSVRCVKDEAPIIVTYKKIDMPESNNYVHDSNETLTNNIDWNKLYDEWIKWDNEGHSRASQRGVFEWFKRNWKTNPHSQDKTKDEI